MHSRRNFKRNTAICTSAIRSIKNDYTPSLRYLFCIKKGISIPFVSKLDVKSKEDQSQDYPKTAQHTHEGVQTTAVSWRILSPPQFGLWDASHLKEKNKRCSIWEDNNCARLTSFCRYYHVMCDVMRRIFVMTTNFPVNYSSVKCRYPGYLGSVLHKHTTDSWRVTKLLANV